MTSILFELTSLTATTIKLIRSAAISLILASSISALKWSSLPTKESLKLSLATLKRIFTALLNCSTSLLNYSRYASNDPT